MACSKTSKRCNVIIFIVGNGIVHSLVPTYPTTGNTSFSSHAGAAASRLLPPQPFFFCLAFTYTIPRRASPRDAALSRHQPLASGGRKPRPRTSPDPWPSARRALPSSPARAVRPPTPPSAESAGERRQQQHQARPRRPHRAVARPRSAPRRPCTEAPGCLQ